MPVLNCTVFLLLFFIACIYTLSLFLYSSILDYLLNPITIFFETIEKLGHGHCTYRGVTGYQILGGHGAFYSAKNWVGNCPPTTYAPDIETVAQNLLLYLCITVKRHHIATHSLSSPITSETV